VLLATALIAIVGMFSFSRRPAAQPRG
jgi:hypothetical protein